MWPGHHRTITIAGSDGSAVLADKNLLFWKFREETAQDDEIRAKYLALPGAGVGASDPSAGITPDGHRAIFRDFLDCLDNGTKPVIDGHEARKAVEIILAVYQSAKNGGHSVTLPLAGAVRR
jgi:predicted dehydrogenase